MTKTCNSLSYAKYSAVVNANFGVMILSMAGSFAKFKKRTVCSILPCTSKSFWKKRAVSKLTPIAAKTITKLSSLWSKISLPLTKEACLHICAPISLWGKPLAENKGIFCPLAIEFMQSIALIPVWIISWGYALLQGFIGWPLISLNSSAKTPGPPSIGIPEPLKERPSISSDIGILSTSPVNST